jgi:TonB family protein
LNVFLVTLFSVTLGSGFPQEQLRRVVQASTPEYPELMYLSRLQGKFEVALTVAASGEVTDAVVLESPGRYFDSEITAHVRRWRFEPDVTSSVLSVQFVFRLLPRKAPVEERGVFFVSPSTIEIRTREPPVVKSHSVR